MDWKMDGAFEYGKMYLWPNDSCSSVILRCDTWANLNAVGDVVRIDQEYSDGASDVEEHYYHFRTDDEGYIILDEKFRFCGENENGHKEYALHADEENFETIYVMNAEGKFPVVAYSF